LIVAGSPLIELVITVTVLAILTLGVVPLMQVSLKRQKEAAASRVLRQMREAIDQFHREALAGATVCKPINNNKRAAPSTATTAKSAGPAGKTSSTIRACG